MKVARTVEKFHDGPYGTLDLMDPEEAKLDINKNWLWFVEDLFNMAIGDSVLSVGWYPDGDIENGAFRLQLFCNNNIVEGPETRDPAEVFKWVRAAIKSLEDKK